MCHDPGARPPPPPISGAAGVADRREVVLEAADGNRFAAYSATAAGPGRAGMVVLPDVRGLHPFYRELAERFAQAGIHAVAIDYFGRTAGIGPRDEGFDSRPHVARTTPDTVAADVAAAVRHVQSPDGGGAGAVFTVGFCFGGRASFNQAARGPGLAGVIGFYGWPAPGDPDDRDAPTLLAPSYTCPVLGLFGGADRGIPPSAVHGFRRALERAGVEHEIVVYDGAPHSFFDRTAEQHRETGQDAWRRVLDFVARHG